MNDFKKLKVWEEAHNLAKEVYLITKKFPKEEMFGITSQLRRSGASIPANIAEGEGRFYKNEGQRFLYIARGSLYETDYFLLLSKDLGYLENSDYELAQEKIDLVGKLLNGLLRSIKQKKEGNLSVNPVRCALGARS